MGGVSFSKTYNESVQDASQTINQQYSGTCNIQCQNVDQNTNITCLNCNIGGNVEVDQTCAANGNCIFNTNQQATADVVFKAQNVAAVTPQSIWEALIPHFNISDSTNISRQNIVENINQSVTQACAVSSVNQLDNTNIFLANSNVGGSILINQSGNTQGSCALNSMMSANAYATGSVDNCAATGKKASKTCSGKGGKKIGSTLVWIIVGIAVVVVFFIIAKVLGNRRSKKAAPGTPGAPGAIAAQSQSQPQARGRGHRGSARTTLPVVAQPQPQAQPMIAPRAASLAQQPIYGVNPMYNPGNGVSASTPIRV